MNIATIQKRKLLNNIYKLYYSSGTKPTEGEIRNIFNQYFFFNKLGSPLSVDYTLLQSISLTDVNIINELMANSIFNLEVLYESIIENNEELFSAVTALNNKLENLKNKRKKLEGKVDQLLFSNNNSDGYFYSYLENFSNLDNIDMNLTSAFIDVDNGQAKIPKITSSISNVLTYDNIITSAASYSVSSNGQTIASNVNINNFDVVFDGLNDTYWSYDFATAAPTVVSLSIRIPLTSAFNISKISGTLLTSSPIATGVTLQSPVQSIADEVFFKNSKSDYNRFSFSVPARQYSNLIITFTKSEPDRVIANSNNPYVYSFGLRELVVGSEYYDKSAVIVSEPIGISTRQNENLLIASVSLDVDSQILSGTSAKYYVCSDIGDVDNLSSFNWIPIEPLNSSGSSFSKIVNLLGSNKRIKYIDSTNADLISIPLNNDSQNLNELNPSKLPNSDVTAYRLSAVDNAEVFIEPFMLANINCLRQYHVININSDSSTTVPMYKSLESWSERIKDKVNYQVYETILTNQFNQISPKINSPSSGFISFSMMMDKATKVSHSISKSRDDFNLAVYLNNVLISDLPSGKSSSNIEWNFVEGINNIVITYDKNFSGLIDFNIMSSARITDYGTMFLDYYNYLDPIEFRRRANADINVFTIDNFLGRREIISSKEISSRSMIQYYAKDSVDVNYVRYRVDLDRYENPLQSPIIDSIRVKFKHVDS